MVMPIAANGATLKLTITDPSGNVSGAQVAAYGPTLAQGLSAADGTVNFDSLPIGNYTVRADASGHVGATASFSVTAPRQALSLPIKLPLATQALSGKVVDPKGNPLGGARVVLGSAWTMTGLDGTYALPVSDPGTLTVKKTGYAQAVTTGGTLVLSPLEPKVAFEDSPFGGDNGAASAAFSSLESALTSLGWIVENRDDPSAEVRVWAAPNALGALNIADITSYVEAGGKIVVMGEWGGSTDYRPDLANALLLPLGVAMEADLVRVDTGNLGRPEWFSPALATVPASQGVSSIAVYGAASVQSATPMQVVAGIPTDGYSVQDADAWAVGLVRQVGAGLVVAVGDTTAWMNDPSDDVGQKDNLLFARNLLTW